MAAGDGTPTSRGTLASKRVLAAGVVGVVLVGAVVVFHGRLTTDFIPLDRSTVGPNLVAAVIQAALVFLLAVLIWPPFRHAAERYIKSHTQPLHDKLDELHAQRERHHAEQMAKLDAIHEHLKQHT